MYRADQLPSGRQPLEYSGSIGILDGWPQLRPASPPVVLGAIQRVVSLWRPTFLVSNFRAGPATWLAFAALAKGWDVRGVVSKGQFEGSPPWHRVHLLELLELCDHTVCADPRARDDRVRQSVDVVVDVATITTKGLPKMGQGMYPPKEAGDEA